MKTTALALFVAVLGLNAQDPTFKDVHTMVPAGKKAQEKQVKLTFANRQDIVVSLADKPLVTIPFSSIQKVNYEYAKRHRVSEGAAIMALSLGTGAIIMLTKSTNHWMGIEYEEGGQLKQLLLRLDKSDYRAVIAAAEEQTGKKVEMLGRGNPQKEAAAAAAAAAAQK